MRKLLFLLLCGCALAQTTTPNLRLQLPAHGSPNWDTAMNGNFNTLDSVIGILQTPFLGAWSSTTIYAKGQEVTFGGSLFQSIANNNQNNQPNTSPSQWVLVFSAGVANSVQENFPIGPGGVSQGQLVTLNNAGQVITASLGGPSFGVAYAGGGGGGTATITVAGTDSCIADNTITSGDILIPASGIAGRCRDSGFQSLSQVPITQFVVGQAIAGGSTGNLVPFQLFASGTLGDNPTFNNVTLTGTINGVTVSGTTGTTNLVFSNSPSLTTPIFTGATTDTINKVSITTPASAATLTIANNKFLTVSNSLTLAGTDGATITFQGSDTYVGRSTTDTLSNKTLTTISTASNCASSASPAVCGSAASGSVAIPVGATPTLQINTTAVTANSQILLTIDESLGTRLSVTCNTTLATLIQPVVTARSGGNNFTIQINSTLVTNPACISYSIIN